jgi:hypothetical protein
VDEHYETLEDLKVLAYVLTTRGTAQIYSGDEIAMQGGGDPDNRHDFPGGFAGEGSSAFEASGRTGAQKETFDWVSKLTALRRKHDALGCGAEQVLASNDDWMVTLRDAGKAAGELWDDWRTRSGGDSSCGKGWGRCAGCAGCEAGDDVDGGVSARRGEIHTGGSTAVVQGETLHLRAMGDAVWLGSCE